MFINGRNFWSRKEEQMVAELKVEDLEWKIAPPTKKEGPSPLPPKPKLKEAPDDEVVAVALTADKARHTRVTALRRHYVTSPAYAGHILRVLVADGKMPPEKRETRNLKVVKPTSLKSTKPKRKTEVPMAQSLLNEARGMRRFAAKLIKDAKTLEKAARLIEGRPTPPSEYP